MRNPFQVLVLFVAIFGLGVGAAFAGGAYWERRGAPATPAPTQAAAPAGPSGAGGGAAGGTAALASQATTGTVEEISGDTVTVRTQAGGTVSVKLQGDTQIRQLAGATAADLRPGLGVVVQGQPDVDGKVAARSVQITGPAGQGGAGGQAPTGGAGGQPNRSPGPRATATATPGR